jgi:serine/threonine protein kinase
MGYNRLADMWSIGMVTYAALSGTLPYDETGSRHAEDYVRDREALFADPRWRDISKNAQNLIIDKLLVVPTNSRITSRVSSI